MIRGFIAALVLSGVALSSGCGGDSANRLYGSMTETYSVAFDQVFVEKQLYNGKLQNYVVRYVKAPGTNAEETPVKIVVNAPVVQGEQKDLLKDGAILRAAKGSSFPDMKSGNITFDSLGEVGQTASGKFYVTFLGGVTSGIKVEGTLNGDFSATLGQLGN